MTSTLSLTTPTSIQPRSPEDWLPLLAGYRLLPQLRREMAIDEAIATIECTPEELELAQHQFYQQQQITEVAQRQAWLAHYGMTTEQLQALATRELRLEKFKQAQWDHRLGTYFLAHKTRLDQVVYSLLRTSDLGVAQELFFRIQSGEQSFADLARDYSEGPEAQSGGLIGPVDLNHPHPALARLLAISYPGQLHSPQRIGDWAVVVRLEQRIAARLDQATRQQLRDRLFEEWLQSRIQDSRSA